MRLRNIKNKEEILNNSNYLVKDAFKYKGKWSKFFNNSNPIYIEIGMGFGKFIVENALKNPNINYIGIEKLDNVLARTVTRIPDDISNLAIIRLNALDIEEVFNKEIDRIYLNFSDPWPKERHSMRRLTSEVFLKKYDSIFKKDKEIYMKTDNRDLYIYSLMSLSEYGYKLSDISFDLHSEEKEIITTEYEDKFIKKGLPIYNVVAKKSKER